jgi:hypothetical protein
METATHAPNGTVAKTNDPFTCVPCVRTGDACVRCECAYHAGAGEVRVALFDGKEQFRLLS